MLRSVMIGAALMLAVPGQALAQDAADLVASNFAAFRPALAEAQRQFDRPLAADIDGDGTPDTISLKRLQPAFRVSIALPGDATHALSTCDGRHRSRTTD